MISVPVREPEVAGEKVMTTTHNFCACNVVEPQEVPEIVKSPLIDSVVIVSGALPVLLTSRTTLAPVVPTSRSPNDTLAGCVVSRGPTPCPETTIVCGEITASSFSVIDAETAELFTGANVS